MKFSFERAKGAKLLQAKVREVTVEPHAYDPGWARQLLAEAGYPNGFDAGDIHPWPSYFSVGEAVAANLAAVGIKTRVRTMERAAFYSALASKKLKGVCVCINAVYGNAAFRLSQTVPSDGAFAYGAYPDIDALYRQQANETDRKKCAELLRQIQTLLPRARAFRADLRLHLAEQNRAARGRAGAHAHRPVSVVGAARGGSAAKALRGLPAGPAADGDRLPRR